MEKKKDIGKKKQNDETLNIDFSGLTKFFKSLEIDPKVMMVVGLILVAMVLSIHFRVESAYLPVTDNWATNAVHSGIKNNIATQVNQQFPNLPAQNKQELVNQQFERLLKEQQGTLDQQIKGTSDYFKSRLQDDSGQTYFLAIDPYTYYRQIRNWVEKDHIYDVLKDGVPWNNHMLAPKGQPMRQSFHVMMGYWTYKMVHLFNSNLSLMTVFFYLPVLFSALSVIPAFFIVKRKTGNFGGFVAATIVAVHTSFLGRTAAGFSDTDAYNVFFPLLITWLFIEAFESREMKKKITFSSLAGVSVGVFSLTWGGWWYIFDFLLVVLGGYFVYVVAKQFLKNRNIKKILTAKPVVDTVVVGGVFTLFSVISSTLFSGVETILSALSGPLGFRIIKDAARATLWPNVFTTVAELGSTSLNTIINAIGGKLFFFIAALGMILTMLNLEKISKRDVLLVGVSAVLFLLLTTSKFLGMNPIKYLIILSLPVIMGLILSLRRDDEIDVKYALFLTIWFVGTIYASTKGVRFILLLVPAFAVAFGLSLGMIKNLVTTWIRRELKVEGKWLAPVIMVLLLFFLITPLKSAGNVAQNEVPSMNDAWWASLSEIKEQSQPDAIINSWWDFGHWFKTIGDRAVTFDGASQNTPMAHWIGKVMLTNDEKISIGILRMLDCGSNSAFDSINKKYDDTTKSVKIVNEIIILDRRKAKKVLQNADFSDSESEEILGFTHCEPPENYFITSEDMVGKAGVWGHFGSWSFERAYIYSVLRHKTSEEAVNDMVEKFDYDESQATNLYFEAIALPSENSANQWISPWPNYVTGRWLGCRNDSSIITCNPNIVLNTQNNQRNVLEEIKVDLNNVEESSMKFGAYDVTSNARVGEGSGVAHSVAIADEDGIEVTKLESSTFGYTMLIDTVDGYKLLVTHPLFADSLFTKLFYLNGRYVDHFDKFSDKQSVNGQKIVVWKVDWDGK